MKITKILCVAAAALAIGLTSCASNSNVSRVDAESLTDVNEYWNDNDIDIVCKSLIAECIQSPRIAKFENDNGRVANVKIDRIRNDSSEFIDTSIVALKFQNAIINSGVVDFVAGNQDVQALREEQISQIDHASEETQASIGNETGADFMLLGSVKSVVQYSADGKTGTRRYYVTAQMMDLTTTKIIWSSQNDQIKKVIKRAGHKL